MSVRSASAVQTREVSRPETGAAHRTVLAGTDREAEAILLCDCVIDVVAAMFSVSSKELRAHGRTSHDVCRVRQIAMYVAHVVLELKMSEVGKGFGRDRTTVVYACHMIEDLREDEDFERVVSTVERVMRAAFRHRQGG